MHWYLDVLKNYATLSGRGRRKEYWTFLLVNVVVASVFGGVDVVLFVPGVETGANNRLTSLSSACFPTTRSKFSRSRSAILTSVWVMSRTLLEIDSW